MGDIDREGVEKAYGRWAPVYDLVFGKVFDAGRQSTIAEADRIGGRILDVGVGTGLSLSDYSRSTRICGVDISEPMLRKAQQRVRAQKLANVETLAVMDAKNLAFKDASFDAVVAQYVITAVPDPEGTLDDFVRVLKPGGELILVNHIGAESGPRRALRARLCASGAPARLASGISLGAAGRMGGKTRRHDAGRAAADAADGAFLADPLSQIVNAVARNRRGSRRPFSLHEDKTGHSPSCVRLFGPAVRIRAGAPDPGHAAAADCAAPAAQLGRLRADVAGWDGTEPTSTIGRAEPASSSATSSPGPTACCARRRMSTRRCARPRPRPARCR